MFLLANSNGFSRVSQVIRSAGLDLNEHEDTRSVADDIDLRPTVTPVFFKYSVTLLLKIRTSKQLTSYTDIQVIGQLGFDGL
jgi:hypothetical protein